MYLIDREIRELLPELRFTGPVDAYPFDADAQVQPSSVDLRVSNIFWRPSRRRRFWRHVSLDRGVVDLRRSQLQALAPLRDWKRLELDEGDAFTIRPGQVVMGRIYERFRVPAHCAGKIEGRSSYARLGLAIHLTGDFINPGWEGFMPLQLFNAAPYPLRLTPYLPICQLMLIRLTDEPEHTYGAPELKSKYVNDDGGPSLWWRDEQVERLQDRLGEVSVADRLQQQIVDAVRFQSPDVLDRLLTYVQGRRVRDIENRDQLLEAFAEREDWRRRRDLALLGLPALVWSGVIGSVLVPFSVWHVLLILAGIATLVAALGASVRRDGGYLGMREVRAARHHPKEESS